MEQDQMKRGLFTSSITLRFFTELRAEIDNGNIREDVAKKAADIIMGKTGLKPWSEAAIDQAKSITWVEMYKDQPKYSEGGRKTPFEKLIDRFEKFTERTANNA